MKAKVLTYLIFLLPSIAMADVLGVQDTELLAESMKQLAVLKDEYAELKKQYDVLSQQKTILEEVKGSVSGHYGYSNLYENKSLSDWQHAGGNFNALLSGDFKSGDPLKDEYNRLLKEFSAQSGSDIFNKDVSKDKVTLFDLMSKTTTASRASNQLSFNKIDEEIKLLDSLQKEIENSPNEKATMDLLARINVEQAKLTAYQIKSGAMDRELIALKQQEEINGDVWSSKFLKVDN